MRTILPALIVGLLFGIGLTISSMVDPARVLGFLDVAGEWDPTLAFVLASALFPSAIAYRIRQQMHRPLLEAEFNIPQGGRIDRRLIGGSALFGVGWGLVGLCPGPAVAGLVFGGWQSILFAAAMVGGMLLHRAFANQKSARAAGPAQ